MRGSLLGDATMWRTRNENQVSYFSATTAVFEYAVWKQSELSNLCTRGILTRNRTRLGTPVTAYEVNTASHPVFRDWRKLWYPDGKKEVPEGVADWLNPLSIAVWFMDDGYRENDRRIGKKIYHGRKIGFCTDAFSDIGIARLIEALSQFGVSPYTVSGCRITFTRSDSVKMIELMQDHILPCFAYKLDIFSPDVRCND
jgi:hypothetical protein